jgi:hypothetical protein
MADPGINASFIPKGDIKRKKKRGGGFSLSVFLLIALIIFFTALAASAGVYFLREDLISKNDQTIIELERNRDNYGLTAIESYIELNNRIAAAEIVLAGHITTDRIFEIIEQDTLTEVVISNFTFSVSKEDGVVTVNANGVGPDFESVALQADQYATNNDIQDLILSDVNQDREGGVSFSIFFTVDKNILLVK